jgi:hypothetical protein
MGQNAEIQSQEEKMQIRKLISSAVILLTMLVLTGCGAPAAPTYEAPAATYAGPAAYENIPGMSGSSDGAGQAAPAAPAATAAAIYQTGPDTITNIVASSNHMIVKNGNIKLLVKDSDRALDGVTQIVSDVQGYIVSSRVWYQDYFGTNYKYATLTMGVPQDQFENALRRLRGLALRVLDENATGEDVTDQYVDFQSQLTNLEATRDRIKGFLDQAKTVDEALRINQQLSDVEAQIEQIKGKMNYLSDRSTFSTITIDLEPDLPPVITTPTPTPTPAPVQPLGAWDPGKTTLKATNALVSAYRVIIDLLIWIFVVLVPIFAPPILFVWLIVWLIKRKSKPAVKA